MVQRWLQDGDDDSGFVLNWADTLESGLRRLSEGNVDVVLCLNGSCKYKRLMSITPGAIFGEMAIVDGAKRAADIVAGGPAVCYVLTQAALDTLKRDKPELALDFSMILAKIISRRLRVANDIIAELEM